MAPKNDRPQRQETRKLLPELRLKVNRDRRKPRKADRLSGCPEGRGGKGGGVGTQLDQEASRASDNPSSG